MKFIFFPGCKIEHYLKHYETSSRAVLDALGVRLVDIEMNCCGYPARHHDLVASVLSAARNLALAAKKNLDILTPCKCCFGNLKFAVSRLREDSELRRRVNLLLEREGLRWEDQVSVKHLLSVLYHDVGLDTLRSKIKKPYTSLKIAPHYGCHALRPSRVVQFDDPLSPTIFEKLVDVTGAQSVEWPKRLECCGNPLWGKNNPLSIHMMQKKVEDAIHAGADFLCVACTYCQIQFDQVRTGLDDSGNSDWKEQVPSILYTQLLGLSLGLSYDLLGLENNEMGGVNLTRHCR